MTTDTPEDQIARTTARLRYTLAGLSRIKEEITRDKIHEKFCPYCFSHGVRCNHPLGPDESPLNRYQALNTLDRLAAETLETLQQLRITQSENTGDLNMQPKARTPVSTAKPAPAPAPVKPAPAPAPKVEAELSSDAPAKAEKAPRAPALTGEITLRFNDVEFTSPEPKTARKWLRKHNLSVRDGIKDDTNPNLWVFDMEGPVIEEETAPAAEEEAASDEAAAEEEGDEGEGEYDENEEDAA